MNRFTVLENLKNAELCTDVIGSEVRAQHKTVKKYEEQVAPINGRIRDLKSTLKEAFEKTQGQYSQTWV